MSSLEVSDYDYSSEDEDVILASMETKSGLPQKLSGSGHHKHGKTMQSDTAVATVKMSGAVMRQGVNLYDTDSEDEDIMKSLTEKFSNTSGRTDSTVSKKSRQSESSVSSDKTLRSSTSRNSCGAADVNLNGNVDKSEQSVADCQIKGCSEVSDSSKNGDLNRPRPSSYKETRFNPFDRDLHIDEDHFEDQNNFSPKARSGRLKSGKCQTNEHN